MRTCFNSKEYFASWLKARVLAAMARYGPWRTAWYEGEVVSRTIDESRS